MSYFLVPHHYFTLDEDEDAVAYAPSGWVDNQGFSASNSAEDIVTFDIYKAFSTDNGECYKASANTSLRHREVYLNTTQALIYLTGEVAGETGTNIKFYSATDYPATDKTLKAPQAVYGDGEIDGEKYYISDALYPARKALGLVTYTAESSYKYFSVDVVWIKNRVKFYNISHGILIELPDNYKIENISVGRKYQTSGYTNNMVGRPLWEGMMDTNIQRSFVLEYEGLSESLKNTLFNIFRRGYGALPFWFIEDIDDNSTWVYGRMPSMNVTEAYAGYFNVSLNFEEY